MIVFVLGSLGLLGIRWYAVQVSTVRDMSLKLGTPSSMTVSDYGSAQTPAGPSVTIVMPDQRIASVMRDLQDLPYLGEQVVSSCPNDDGSYYEVRLNYSGRASRTIDIRKTGCRDVFVDGRWSRRAPETWSQLIPDVDRLLASKQS
jgi:hypothetical protein